MQSLLLTVVVLIAVAVDAKRWREGPVVDPGVFVITHIRSCRNGAGYCILGKDSCVVDTDFVPDDLGGDCESLGSAFSPPAVFTCCKENPANFEEEEGDHLDAVVLESNAASSTSAKPETSVVTEVVTEIQTEVVTEVEEMTELFPVTEIYTLNDTSSQMADAADNENVTEAISSDFDSGCPVGGDAELSLSQAPNLGAESVEPSLGQAQDAEWPSLGQATGFGELAVGEYQWSQPVPGQPEVYEVELGAEIVGSNQVDADILKPGLVIDDPSLLYPIQNPTLTADSAVAQLPALDLWDGQEGGATPGSSFGSALDPWPAPEFIGGSAIVEESSAQSELSQLDGESQDAQQLTGSANTYTATGVPSVFQVDLNYESGVEFNPGGEYDFDDDYEPASDRDDSSEYDLYYQTFGFADAISNPLPPANGDAWLPEGDEEAENEIPATEPSRNEPEVRCSAQIHGGIQCTILGLDGEATSKNSRLDPGLPQLASGRSHSLA